MHVIKCGLPMKKNNFITIFVFILIFVAAPLPAADTMRCIGDYHDRGHDKGFYWYFVEIRMNASAVEGLSWETSYASDPSPRGRSCRIDASGFTQSRLPNNTIIFKDPDSSCTVSLAPKKRERGALLLDASGCVQKYCPESGVFIPITVSLVSKKCLPVTKK